MAQRPDRDSPVPLYHQIVETLRYRIATGRLRAGDALPTLREAAKHWGVNLHTVRRAYGELADLRWVVIRRPQGAFVSVVPAAAGHPILKGFHATWSSTSNVYHVAPLLDKTATVLLNGKVPKGIEPIAWTRTAGRSRIFYTSLGHPSDFGTPQFRTLLVNGIRWALDAKAP